ncbi:MAG: hypothetical protein UX71_C0010G0003 [Parcubacteria group bacterium GW2011_GWA1_47_10]|nr:MAG: hypothetical protein UX71_C0010G0003 [Parcubacteria group bacterium GW2011_GWA1_47_10]
MSLNIVEILIIFIAGMVAGALVPQVSTYWHNRHRAEAEPGFRFQAPDLSGASPAVSVATTRARRKAKKEAAKEAAMEGVAPGAGVGVYGQSEPDVFRPPAGVVAQQKEKKDANIQAILGAFAWATESKLRTPDVEKMLGVSESTALRYLDELEKDHKIRKEIAADRRAYYVKLS